MAHRSRHGVQIAVALVSTARAAGPPSPLSVGLHLSVGRFFLESPDGDLLRCIVVLSLLFLLWRWLYAKAKEKEKKKTPMLYAPLHAIRVALRAWDRWCIPGEEKGAGTDPHTPARPTRPVPTPIPIGTLRLADWVGWG